MNEPPVIRFSLLALDELEVMRPLWEQLNQHHATLRTPFASEIALHTYESRSRVFCDKAASGHLRVEIARIAAGEPPVAYCVTSLSPDGAGEVDSLFVAPAYRRRGIASALMQRALDWLRDSGAACQRVVVLHANDEAVAFYRRCGFHPRNIELELPPNPK